MKGIVVVRKKTQTVTNKPLPYFGAAFLLA